MTCLLQKGVIFIFNLVAKERFNYFKLAFVKSLIFYKFDFSFAIFIKTNMFFITMFSILF